MKGNKDQKLSDMLELLKIYSITEEYKEFMALIKDLSMENHTLSELELENVIKCLKMNVDKYYQQFKKLKTYNMKEKSIQDMHSTVVDKTRVALKDAIEQGITLANAFLKNKESIKQKAKIAFTKLLADFFDLQFEITNVDDYLEKAKSGYEYTKTLIKKYKFPVNDVVVLTYYLNYTVFLTNRLKDKDGAIQISKQVLEEITRGGLELKEKHQKDIYFLCQLIKDNLSLWTSEIIIDEQVKLNNEIMMKRLNQNQNQNQIQIQNPNQNQN